MWLHHKFLKENPDPTELKLKRLETKNATMREKKRKKKTPKKLRPKKDGNTKKIHQVKTRDITQIKLRAGKMQEHMF